MQILGQWEHGRRASLKHAKEEEQLAAVPEATQDARISLTESLVVRSQSASPAAKKAAVSPAALDIDADDLADPLAVATYAADIFAYYRRVEPVFRTSPDYMRIQASPNPLSSSESSQLLAVQYWLCSCRQVLSTHLEHVSIPSGA